MAKSTTPRWTCDRCGHAEDAETLPSAWGKFAVADTERTIGVERECHLCPGCVRSVFEHFDAPTAPVEQPVPQIPERRPRPVFTIEDRARAVDKAVEVLAAQSASVIDRVLQEPAGLLADGGAGAPAVILGLLEGVDDRAREIVDTVIAELNFTPA